jgi:mannosyltransferase
MVQRADGLRRPEALVVALTIATAAVGFVRLGDRSIDVDEGTSISYAWRNLSGLGDAIRGDPNMSLYYVVLWVSQHVLGDEIHVLRSLSVLFAALTVPVVYAIGARLFGVRGGLAAAVIFAVNAFVLRYAQDARGYTLVALLVTVSSWFFLRELSASTRWTRIGYVASSVLAMYAHLFAGWVLIAHVVTIVAIRRRETHAGMWCADYAAIGLLCVPLMYFSIALPGDPIGWLHEPGYPALRDALQQIAGDSFRVLGAAIGIWLLALPRVVRSVRLRRQFALPFFWLSLPILLAFALSQWHAVFLPRYLIVCVPAFALVTAGALASLRTRGALAALLAVIVVFSLPPLRTWYKRPPDQDWKALTAYVLDRSRAGDAVIFDAIEVPFGYYAKRAGRAPPAHIAGGRGWEEIATATNDRVWLVLGQPSDAERVRRALGASRYRLHDARRFGETMSVELFTRS